MNPIFESQRLFLVLFEDAHIEGAKGFWGNEEVMAFCNGAIPHEALGKVLRAYRSCHDLKGVSVYAVIEKESGAVIGAAGFNVPETTENIELIFHFSKKYWGRGYAKEAAQACLEIARQHEGVKSIFASADPKNAASLKILENIGFQYRGMKWFDDTNQEEPYYEYVF